MQVHLAGAYEEICAEYHATPLASFLAFLGSIYAGPDGEVFIDASVVAGDHFCIFAELLRRVLRRPNQFIYAALVRERNSLSLLEASSIGQEAAQEPHVYYAVPPRLLQLKLKLSCNVNNGDVERVCELIGIQKDLSCLPLRIPKGRSLIEHGTATGTLAQLSWPEMAVIESIDVRDCVFISLAGGRALRAAARRNAYLLNIPLDGCSVNAAVVAQTTAAVQQNWLRFYATCGR